MRFFQSWNRKVNIFFTTILIIIAIGFSRIYLGVHYISDVWSGYLVGAMWLIIAISFSEWLGYHQKSVTNPYPLLAEPVLISFVLVFIAILFYASFFNTLQSCHWHQCQTNSAVVVSKSTDIFTDEQMKIH